MSSVKLDVGGIRDTTIAAVLIMAGVITKNTVEQMKTENMALSYAAMGLFTLGWLLMALAIADGRQTMDKVVVWIASMTILGSVLLMKGSKMFGYSFPSWAVLLFVAGWITLGYSLSRGVSGTEGWVGIVAALMVLVSMLGSLPWQREGCIVDGPGMNLFTAAWALIVYIVARSRTM